MKNIANLNCYSKKRSSKNKTNDKLFFIISVYDCWIWTKMIYNIDLKNELHQNDTHFDHFSSYDDSSFLIIKVRCSPALNRSCSWTGKEKHMVGNWTWWTFVELPSMAGNSISLRVLFRTQRYFFINSALSINDSTPFKSKFNEEFFTQKLLNSQLPDGSWKQLVD